MVDYFRIAARRIIAGDERGDLGNADCHGKL
jgi:hypothetical protein